MTLLKTLAWSELEGSAGWDPIIHTYKRTTAFEMYKVMKEECEHRLGNIFKRPRIKEEKVEVM